MYVESDRLPIWIFILTHGTTAIIRNETTTDREPQWKRGHVKAFAHTLGWCDIISQLSQERNLRELIRKHNQRRRKSLRQN